MAWVDISGWTSLHPNAKKLWAVQTLISGLIVTALAAGGQLIGQNITERQLLFPFAIPLGAALLWFGIGFLTIGPRYRNYRYSLGEDDLRVSHGYMWRTLRTVARTRIQHIDVQAGPVAKSFGLVTVKIFVAGHAAEVAELPGVTPEVAESLRQALVLRQLPPDVAPPVTQF